MVGRRCMALMGLLLIVGTGAGEGPMNTDSGNRTAGADASAASNRDLLSVFFPRTQSLSRTAVLMGEAGTSNKIISIVSGVALAALMGRRPVVVWTEDFDKRFERPTDIVQIINEPKHISESDKQCDLKLTHTPQFRSCFEATLWEVDYSKSWPKCSRLIITSGQVRPAAAWARTLLIEADLYLDAHPYCPLSYHCPLATRVLLLFA